MKKSFMISLTGIACLLVVAAVTLAAKERAKPILETYSARVVPAAQKGKGISGGVPDQNYRLSGVQMYDIVEARIQEFSTDQEVADLARTFQEGGDKALEKAFKKNKKGYFKIGRSFENEIFYVTSSRIVKNPSNSEGPVKILGIIANVPEVLATETQTGLNAPRYTYTYLEFRVDEQGRGTGLLVVSAMVNFDEQNRPVIKPLYKQTFQLGDVQLEK